MRFRSLAFALLALAPTWALAQTPTAPITLEQAMADPDWIGPPVEQAWWSWDSQRVLYTLKRNGSPVRDTYLQKINAAAGNKVADNALADLDAAQPVYDRNRRHALFVRNGDVFERDLVSGALTQITRSDDNEAEPQFAGNGSDVQFHVGNDWYRWSPGDRLVAPVALPRAEKDPDAAPAPDALRDMQLRLIATLKRQKDNADALHAQSEAERKADATRAAQPIYLGDKVQIDASTLSPNGRWLIVVVSPKDADAGKIDKIPHYVSASGYVEGEDARTRVGRNVPIGQSLRLIDLSNGQARELSLDALPGIAVDPLAALRAAQKLPALNGNRAVRVQTDGDNSGQAVHWSDDGSQVALLLRAVDNKDRWIATVNFADAKLFSVHRLTDQAWINWNFNDFGWLPDNRTLWFLSEQSGYSQLYTTTPGAAAKALTTGTWEVSSPTLSADGKRMYFLCNRKWPGDYEICAKDFAGGDVRELTALDGVEDFALSPDGNKLLLRYSGSYLPAQAAVVAVAGGDAVKLTDTRTPDYKARNWIAPQYVQVPSTHGAGVVWAKLYRPATLAPGKKYPVVMFVHGAGYIQNVFERFPYYFREQMFDNLLVQQGYVVLDMDYRASEGYGRAWRTAIYRNMGHPELDDYLDGVHWMIANQQGDAAHVGIYGGSYGGFMTFMAMFRAPDVFAAGAALRPVSDWTSYNHEYTSNILNTPDLDPDAYKTSSPIEYAEGLRGHLLIAHGMMDDNVFFQDSVRLTQRLIELRKDHWQLAPYPLERHSFVNAEAWFDEYRRIDELFEQNLK
jgi:dipeptidyl aminopeptidase/acylaminoacyl peptidase